MPNIGIMASSVVIDGACTDVLAESFNNLTNWTTGAGTPTLVTGRTGTAVSLGDSVTARIHYSIPTLNQADTVTVGFAYRVSNLNTRPFVELWSDTNTTEHTKFVLTSSGAIQAQRAASGLGSSAAGLVAANTWYYVELQMKLHDTTGFVIVRLNGAEVLNLSGLDTKNAGTKTVYDTLRLLGVGGGTHSQQYDDLYLSSGAGCTFKGDLAAAPPTTPVSGSHVWLDADDASMFTYSSGTVVSQWADKSGNNRHFTQGTVAAQPSRSGTQHSRSTVVFTGTKSLARSLITTAVDNVTMFAACVRTSGGTFSLVFHNGDVMGNGYGLAIRANSAYIGLLRAGVAWDTTSTADPAVPVVLTLQRVSGTWSMWLNGTATNLASTVAPVTPTTSTTVGDPVGPFVGSVYEILFYNRAMTTLERQQVESYLKDKWGTT